MGKFAKVVKGAADLSLAPIRAVGDLLSPDIPASPPPPPVPKRTDPEVDEAGRRQREADRLRRGRRATILTSSRGVEDQLGVTRPEARGARLLGE